MCLSFAPFEAQNSLFLLPVQVRSTSRLDETRIKCTHQWFSSLNVVASKNRHFYIYNLFIYKYTHTHNFTFFFIQFYTFYTYFI